MTEQKPGIEERKIYLVAGTSGEYSDRREWIVKAFFTQESAIDFQKQINDWCLENKVSRLNERDNTIADYEVRDELKCPLDPNFYCDYTGTDYYITETVLSDSDQQQHAKELEEAEKRGFFAGLTECCGGYGNHMSEKYWNDYKKQRGE